MQSNKKLFMHKTLYARVDENFPTAWPIVVLAHVQSSGSKGSLKGFDRDGCDPSLL